MRTLWIAFGSMAIITSSSNAQGIIPPLPDLRFAQIVRPDKYLGDRWSYMEAGRHDAPPIVLLHGVGGNSMDWRFQLGGLADRFRVVAWNAPGYMLSDGLKEDDPGCAGYATALADFLDALDLDRVNVVGNSFGSRVAQCFAMHYPDRLISLALIGPSAGPEAMSAAAKAETLATRQAQIASGGYAFGARADALVSPRTSPELMAIVRNGTRATNARGFMQGVKLGLHEDYSPATMAARVTVPVLIVAGSEDRVSPIVAHAAVIKRALPRARLEVLPGIGHLPHLESPDRVNALLREFLLSRSRAGVQGGLGAEAHAGVTVSTP